MKAAKVGFIKACVQACARWAGIPIDAGDGTAFNLGSRLVVPTESAALRLSAVWACVTLLSDTISTLPLGFYKKTPAGRVEALDHPLDRVLSRQPNEDMTASQFIGATMASMLLRGVAYWEKNVSAGRVIGLDFLVRDRLSVTCLPDGTERYSYTEKGKIRHIPASRIVKIIGFSLDGKNGLSAIEYACCVFGAALSAQTAANATFERGLLQTVAFKYPQVLRKDQRDDAREAIEQISGAVNAGKAVILEGGTDAMTLGIKPSDAQLLESRAFSAEEICSWFRVQPFMIGRAADGQTNWGTGIEQQMIGFITFTLAPWLRRIEQSIAKELLRPEEKGIYYAEFSLEGLLRGDSAARSAFYSSALQNGWMNRAQVARYENLPPPPGGDVYTVQSNLIPIDKIGMAPPPAANVRSALLEWLKEEASE